MQRQPRVTDLIPRRGWVFALLWLAGAACIAGFEALYFYMPTLAEKATDGRISAFDLDGEGGLAVWATSTTLFLASCVALIIYSIRRQRADDYHGRYRFWLLAAICWMVMSVDEGGSLHEGFKELMSHATGTRLMGDGSLWWVIPYTLALGVVGVRLLMEMRVCRGSTLAFVAAGVCYVVAVVTQLELIMPETGMRGVMLEEGCEMFGALFVLLAMGLHARHVILEAEGLLPQKKKKRKRKDTSDESEESAAEAKPSRWRRKATAEAKAAEPAKSASATVKAAAKTAASSKPLAEAVAQRKLGDKSRIDGPESAFAGKQTRAQRKALRRQQKLAARRGDDDD